MKSYLVSEVVEVDGHSVVDVDGKEGDASRVVPSLCYLDVVFVENHFVVTRFVQDVLREMLRVICLAHGSELHFVLHEIVKLQGVEENGNVLDSDIQETPEKNQNEEPFWSDPQHLRTVSNGHTKPHRLHDYAVKFRASYLLEV